MRWGVLKWQSVPVSKRMQMFGKDYAIEMRGKDDAMEMRGKDDAMALKVETSAWRTLRFCYIFSLFSEASRRRPTGTQTIAITKFQQ